MSALLLTLMLGCQAADIGTTYAALRTGRFVEANPLIRAPRTYVVKVGVNVGAVIWRQQAAPASPAKWIIPAGLAIAGCAAAGWNAHQIRAGK